MYSLCQVDHVDKTIVGELAYEAEQFKQIIDQWL